METNYYIEYAKVEDIRDMLQLWQVTPGLGIGEGDDGKSLGKFINKNPSTCLIIKSNQDIVGTVLGGFDGRRGYIYHLAVHPEHQQKGLGKLLLKNVLIELELVGATKVHLFVFNKNDVALQFYLSQGWELRRDIQIFSWNKDTLVHEICLK
mgnify:FL=1